MLDPLSQHIVIRLFHIQHVDKSERLVCFGSNQRIDATLHELISLGIVIQAIQSPSPAQKPSNRLRNSNSKASNSPLLTPKLESSHNSLSTSGNDAILSLDPSFAKSFREALEEPINEVEVETFDISARLKGASRNWEFILLFILQFCDEIDKKLLDGERADPNAAIIEALEKANLLIKV